MAKNKQTQKPVFIATTSGKVIDVGIFERYAMKGDGEQSASLPTDRFYGDYQNLLPPTYDPEVMVGLLEINTWHNRCVKTKANDVAGLGYGLSSVGDEDNQAEGDKERLNTFFTDRRHKRPIAAILTDVQTDKETLGYCSLEIVRDKYDPMGDPVVMAHIPAHTVRVHKTGNKYMQKRGVKKRWFKRFGYLRDIHKEEGTEHPMGTLEPLDRATEIIWDTNFSGRSDYYGMPDILPALGSVEGLVAVRDYNISFFRNHGIPAYAIYITGDYSLGELKNKDGVQYDAQDDEHDINDFDYEIIREVKRHLNTIAQNPHAPLLLAIPSSTPEGKVELNFKPLNVEVKEGSFRLYRKDSRDEVIVAHGVPSYRIGLVETGALGGSVAVESTRIYRDSVIAPRKRALENLINQFIIREGFMINTWEFRLEALDIAEEDEHEKEMADFLFRRMAMTPAQLIERFGAEFGLELPSPEEFPELYIYYLDNQIAKPVLPGGEGEGLTTAVKAFQSDLLTIAIKSAQKDEE